MIRTAYEQFALIDTSAVIALHDPADQFHAEALRFFSSDPDLDWGALNATTHECFTHVRYRGAFQAAIEHYEFMRRDVIRILEFVRDDEDRAEDILRRYSDHPISFHDALCAAVMLRFGIYKIFSFDRHFRILGFEVMPGLLATGA